jgi:hypothetical protein
MLIILISLISQCSTEIISKRRILFTTNRSPLHILSKVERKYHSASEIGIDVTYLAVFRVEMAMRRHIFLSFRESERQFATWIPLPEKYIRYSIIGSIARYQACTIAGTEFIQGMVIAEPYRESSNLQKICLL